MRRAVITKRLLPLALALASIALPAHSFGFPPHRREARDQILALEGQWRNAQLSNDVAAMDKLLADDYLGISSQGEVLTKTQQLERMRTRQLDITSLEASDIKVKIAGRVAIVTSLAAVQGSSDHHVLDGNYRYTRIYEHLPSGVWKITNFEITRVRSPRNRASTAPPASD